MTEAAILHTLGVSSVSVVVDATEVSVRITTPWGTGTGRGDSVLAAVRKVLTKSMREAERHSTSHHDPDLRAAYAARAVAIRSALAAAKEAP